MLVSMAAACAESLESAESPDQNPVVLKIGHTQATLAEYRFYLEKNYPELEGSLDDELHSQAFDMFKRDMLIAEISQALGFGIAEDQIDAFIKYTMTGMSFHLLEPKTQTLWRQEIRRRLAIQQFLEREILQNVSISDEAIESRYEAMSKSDKSERRRHIRFMQVGSEERAREFLAALKAKKGLFKEIARDYADNEGYQIAVPFALDQLPEPFRKAAARLKPGQHSTVIPMAQGDQTHYYVLYLEYIETEETMPFEEAYRRIGSDLARESSRALLEQKIAQFKNKIPTVVYEENLPFSYIEPSKRKGV